MPSTDYLSLFAQSGGLLGLVVGMALLFAWYKDRQYQKMVNGYEDRLRDSYDQRELIYSRWLEKESKQSEKYWMLANETNATIRELSEALDLDVEPEPEGSES